MERMVEDIRGAGLEVAAPLVHVPFLPVTGQTLPEPALEAHLLEHLLLLEHLPLEDPAFLALQEPHFLPDLEEPAWALHVVEPAFWAAAFLAMQWAQGAPGLQALHFAPLALAAAHLAQSFPALQLGQLLVEPAMPFPVPEPGPRIMRRPLPVPDPAFFPFLVHFPARPLAQHFP
jgi:hypothetical protein